MLPGYLQVADTYWARPLVEDSPLLSELMLFGESGPDEHELSLWVPGTGNKNKEKII